MPGPSDHRALTLEEPRHFTQGPQKAHPAFPKFSSAWGVKNFRLNLAGGRTVVWLLPLEGTVQPWQPRVSFLPELPAKNNPSATSHPPWRPPLLSEKVAGEDQALLFEPSLHSSSTYYTIWLPWETTHAQGIPGGRSRPSAPTSPPHGRSCQCPARVMLSPGNTGQDLETFLVVTTGGEEGRLQHQQPTMHRDSPPPPHVHSATDEKPWSKSTSQHELGTAQVPPAPSLVPFHFIHCLHVKLVQ